ncbi:hypothetical protein [Cryobacterium tepidiphilum]|uniref:Uncharacterized protein n=1 Tax=Cryobacterium tepidiphilum TaxID=2486026 RepID=A0A3M8LN32_9MICO|nr:hypothetical protein [Cryobacterium tepidiphilum]RNE66755.1 hypothetical protein EEJ31_02940 [Cryobacterium tepidiphilum]
MTDSLIPTVDDLAADVVTHHYDDMIAPSGLTNFLGTVRVDHDLTAISAVTFPPVSQGLAATAVLFVDGRVFESYGERVTHAWRPDRVVRSAELEDLRLETVTACVPHETAVAIDVRVTNTSHKARSVSLTLALNARVTAGDASWLDSESPNALNVAAVGGSRLSFRNDSGEAWSIQGVDLPATVRLSGVAAAAVEGYEVGIGGAGRGGEVEVVLDIPAGQTHRFGYVQAVASSERGASDAWERVAADVPGAVKGAERFWNAQLEAAFTPGNTEFSGHLPVLATSSEALKKLYWWGALGVIWFRREFAGNVLGRSYDTLMPNYWATTTFIWDFSLSSLTHALLDPVPMKRQLDHWIASDIHSHFGTSSLTGGPVGRWYSVNDYAMTRLVTDYMRFNSALGYLDETPDTPRGHSGTRTPSTVADHLRSWALAWKDLRGESPLADYGEIDNLLECVSSYTHEVASLNAANVWNMRTAAAIAALGGDEKDAESFLADADELVASVVDLYHSGSGYFSAQQPDGSRLPVRHCYDFNVVGTTIADDLPERMRAEMVEFFRRELQTSSWMRALSPWDADASFSVRPDHQWNGAYPAWPADAARSLIALGAPDVAIDWLSGLARSTNQGPTGQAHFVEEAQPLINGGARKAPPQLPYITDWACSSSGAWVALVIESIFGVDVGVAGEITVDGCIASLDPTAVLHGVRVGDRHVDVYASGEIKESPAR